MAGAEGGGGVPPIHSFSLGRTYLCLKVKQAANTAFKNEGDLQRSAELPGTCGKPETT